MRNGEKIKIDESIKVGSWGNEFQHESQGAQHHFFKKYAGSSASVGVTNVMPESYQQYQTEEVQVRTLESGFRKLKSEQIQKLKDLKSEYEEIRKITTDYVPPKMSKTPSMASSSHHSHSQPVFSPLTPKGQVKFKQSGGHETQILQLQKKQLQIMVENSMKKIEELLHNEMQYKKMIHELRLHKDSKSYFEGDKENTTKMFQKKEKDYKEKIRLMEQERESNISSINTFKDKIKYLENNLNSTEQELRKIITEKRNYEELLRMEKDKYMNLQIQMKREKREHQIFSKDKNAEVSRLMKLVDIKGGLLQKDMRTTISNLEEEVRIKDERYALLLEKFETFQKDQEQQDKQTQLRLVNELMSKSGTDNQNRVFQQTITSIMNRLNELENKPMIEIDNIVNHEHQEHHLENEKLYERIKYLEQEVNQNQNLAFQVQQENAELSSKIQSLQRQIGRLEEQERNYIEQIENLKKMNKNLKVNKSNDKLLDVKTKNEANLNMNIYSGQFKDLQYSLEQLRKEKQEFLTEKNDLIDENRKLRTQVSQFQFAVQKAVQEGQFNLELYKKSQDVRFQELNKDLARLRKIESELTQQNRQIKLLRQQEGRSWNTEAAKFKETIDRISRQKKSFDGKINEGHEVYLKKIQEEHNEYVKELSEVIQKLTNQNHSLQQEGKETGRLLQENKVLKQYLHKMRHLNKECDQLWSEKQSEYEAVNFIMSQLRYK